MASNDPKKKLTGTLGTVGDVRATPTTATSLGEGARRAVDNAVVGGMKFANYATGNLESGINALTLPARYLGGQAADVARGFAGKEQRANAGTAVPGVSIPRPFFSSPTAGGGTGGAGTSAPDFGNVTGGSSSAPVIARPATPAPVLPASPTGTAATAGASPPAGGSADPQPFINAQGQRVMAPAGVSVTRGANGNPVFTATGESVAAGNAALAAPVPAVAAPQIQRPTFGGNAVGASIGIPGEAERKLEIALDGATFAPARSRGARAVQAQRVEGLMQRANLGDQLAAQANNAQLDANTRTNIAQMGEVGQNYRTELNDAGQTQRTTIGEGGANARAKLAQEGENFRLLNRPEYTPDASGNINLLQNGVARPVTDAQGKPVTSAARKGGMTADNVLDAYDKARKAIIDTTPVGQQPDFTALAQSPVGQAYAQLFAGNSSGSEAPSAPTATNPQTGERVQFNSKTGKWEPIK